MQTKRNDRTNDEENRNRLMTGQNITGVLKVEASVLFCSLLFSSFGSNAEIFEGSKQWARRAGAEARAAGSSSLGRRLAALGSTGAGR